MAAWGIKATDAPAALLTSTVPSTVRTRAWADRATPGAAVRFGSGWPAASAGYRNAADLVADGREAEQDRADPVGRRLVGVGEREDLHHRRPAGGYRVGPAGAAAVNGTTRPAVDAGAEAGVT